MMSTGLTFGTISALFGLNHGVIDQTQYSHLVATVIGSAVIPTAIANARFMPRHLLPGGNRNRGIPSTENPWGTWTHEAKRAVSAGHSPGRPTIMNMEAKC